jgi:transcriptional regulator with XRE-family HTH domain
VSKLPTLRRKWRKDAAFRAEYDALEQEFSLAATLIDARGRADLTQAEVARRMATTQAYVAKMEGGRINPSVKTLERFATATGSRLRISFEAEGAPEAKRRAAST